MHETVNESVFYLIRLMIHTDCDHYKPIEWQLLIQWKIGWYQSHAIIQWQVSVSGILLESLDICDFSCFSQCDKKLKIW